MIKSLIFRDIVEINPQKPPKKYAPQSVVVKGKRSDGKVFRFDFGRVCYLDREEDSKRTERSKMWPLGKVYVESLSLERVSWVRNYLDNALVNGWREETLLGRLHYVRYFFQFCDFNEGTKPTTLDGLLKEYQRYLCYLDQRCRLDGEAALGSTSFNGRLQSVRTFIQWAFKLSNVDMLALIPKHRHRKANFESTSSRRFISLENGQQYLRACAHYFNQFADAILKNQYPVHVSPPGTKDKHLYWHSPRGVTLKSLPGCFGADGDPFPENEIRHIIAQNFKSKNQWGKGFYSTTLVINRNAWRNGELTFHKVYAFNLSVFCFFQLYLGLTGANIQPTLDLRLSDINLQKIGLEPFAKKHKFRSGRQFKFTAPRQLKREILKYIRLRKWVESLNLDGDVDDFVFVKIGEDRSLKRFERDNGAWIAKSSPLFKGISMMASREIRKLSGEFFIRKSRGNISLVAKKLNNSIATTAKAYTGVDIDTQSIEMNRYQEELFSKVMMFDRSTKGVIEVSIAEEESSTRIASGACSNLYGEEPRRAEGFNSHAPEPTCGTFESCVFCKYFAMFKDFEDVHKILSLREALSLASLIRDDPEHHAAVVQPVLYRIDEILRFLSEDSQSLSQIVAEVERAIGMGVYSPRWDRQILIMEGYAKEYRGGS